MIEVQRELIERNKRFQKKKISSVIRDMQDYFSNLESKEKDLIENPCHDTAWEYEKTKNSTGYISPKHPYHINKDDQEFDFNLFKEWCDRHKLKVIFNNPNTPNYLFLNIGHHELIEALNSAEVRWI